MSQENTNIAQAIDNSHKDPSEVKDVIVNRVPVIEETLADSLHSFGYDQERQDLQKESDEKEMAKAVVASVGLNPTFKEWKAVRLAVLSGYVAFNETLSKPRELETLENKATNFMRLLEKEPYNFVKPKSKSKDSVRKADEKTTAETILEEKYGGSISVAEDQLKSLDQLTPNLEYDTQEYNDNEKEKTTLRRVIKQAKNAQAAKNKKAVSGTLSNADAFYTKLKIMIRKSGNREHAVWLLDNLDKLTTIIEEEMNKE